MLAGVPCVTVPTRAASFFTRVDVPGATATNPYGINNARQIVGGFADAAGKERGFLRSATGAFTIVDFPGALNMWLSGINRAGQIVGEFQDAGGKGHGFSRTVDGAFTPIDVPGATTTDASGINDAGQIVGGFTHTTVEPDLRRDLRHPTTRPWHGFVTTR